MPVVPHVKFGVHIRGAGKEDASAQVQVREPSRRSLAQGGWPRPGHFASHVIRIPWRCIRAYLCIVCTLCSGWMLWHRILNERMLRHKEPRSGFCVRAPCMCCHSARKSLVCLPASYSGHRHILSRGKPQDCLCVHSPGIEDRQSRIQTFCREGSGCATEEAERRSKNACKPSLQNVWWSSIERVWVFPMALAGVALEDVIGAHYCTRSYTPLLVSLPRIPGMIRPLSPNSPQYASRRMLTVTKRYWESTTRT